MRSNLLNPREVAEMLGVKEDKARQVIAGLPHLNLSGNPNKKTLRIREEVLIQWLADQERQTIGKPAGRKKPVNRTPPLGDRIPRRKEG